MLFFEANTNLILKSAGKRCNCARLDYNVKKIVSFSQKLCIMELSYLFIVCFQSVN